MDKAHSPVENPVVLWHIENVTSKYATKACMKSFRVATNLKGAEKEASPVLILPMSIVWQTGSTSEGQLQYSNLRKQER